MADVRTFSLAFGLMTITNEQLELGVTFDMETFKYTCNLGIYIFSWLDSRSGPRPHC
jgi:hypothetical protein